MAQNAGPGMENYWKEHSSHLKQVRRYLTPDNKPARKYRPLPDKHPLLKPHAGHGRAPAKDRGRQTYTPPTAPPRSRRYSPPNQYRHNHNSPSLKGSKYDVIPPVKPRLAFASPTGTRHRHEDDSWGDESSEEEDEQVDPASGYRSYPYPMMMYPMMMAPPPVPTPRRSKQKKKSKKKVHYRNTPTYLTSRENTIHEPTGTDEYNVFDPRSNSVLARYQYGHVPTPTLSPDHPYYPSSFYYCEDFLDDEIPKMVKEVIRDSQPDLIQSHLLRSMDLRDPMENFISVLVNDAVATEAENIVKESVREMVNQHMERTAVYEMFMDLTQELAEEMGPEIIEEALFENMLEDLVQENLVDTGVHQECTEIAEEVLTHYSDKVRNRDIKEMKRTSGDKLADSFSLDVLLAMITRQGQLWTEGEHADKLLDEIMLSIMLKDPYLDVMRKKKDTLENKPVRRYFEKAVTDTLLDTLLDELSQNLDEDMKDLDEYELGLEDPDNSYHMPAELKKWLDGR